jgi:hypothetical protein
MLKTTLTLASFFCLLLTIISCKPEEINAGDPCLYIGTQVDADRVSYYSYMYPLNKANEWTYRDSTWHVSNASLKSTHQASVLIEEFQVADRQYAMPKFTEPSPFGYDRFVMKGDTICSYKLGQNPTTNKCFTLTPIFINTNDTAVYPNETATGFIKIYRDTATIRTPAGSFVNCLVRNNGNLTYTYLYPPVGIVQKKEFAKRNDGTLVLRRKLSLMEYTLK